MAPVKRGRKPNEKAAVKSEPLKDVPDPPDHLGEFAQQYWKKLAPQLVAANILTALHLESFAILCETYEEYRVLSTWLRADPSRATVIAASGYVSESPQVRMRDRANANLQKLWLKFGLTPMALAQMRKHGGVGGKTVPKIKAFAAKRNDEQE